MRQRTKEGLSLAAVAAVFLYLAGSAGYDFLLRLRSDIISVPAEGWTLCISPAQHRSWIETETRCH